MEENAELPNLNETDKGQDSPESIAADEFEITARNWWSILQLLGAYLVGAWTILQFLDWIFTRNQVSPYWVDLFMWIFIGLLPAILFYLFYKERIDRFGSNRRDKFVFSSNLVILILVLFFSFRNTDLGATTKEITFIDASGAAQHKTIIKQEFRKKIMIFNFEPQDVDSSFLWLNGGIRTLLALDAQQDKAFLIGNQTGKTSMASKISSSEGFDLFIDGQYHFNGERYEATPQIYNAKNGKSLSQKVFVGDDLYALIDSISWYVREQSGVAKSLIEASTDLPIESFTSSSLTAVEYLSKGGYANYERALQLDSTFALASLYLGISLYSSDISELDTKLYLDQAFRHREKLPFDWQNSVLSYRYMAYRDFEAAEKVLQLQLEIDPDSDIINQCLVNVYRNSKQLDKLLAFTSKWSQRDLFGSAEAYASALLLKLKSRKILNTVKPFAQLYPKNELLAFLIFKAHLLDKNWEAAAKVLEKIKLINPQYDTQIKLIEQSIAYQKANAIPKDQYQAFIGINKFYDSERTASLFLHPERTDLIIAQVPNNLLLFFPFSDNQLIELRSSTLSGITLHEMKKDSNNSVYGMQSEIHSVNRQKPGQFFQWRIDSLVLKAEALLLQQDYERAEAAYEAAIMAHPKLYFLQDVLQHIQYVKGKTAGEIQKHLASTVGLYGDRRFWMEEGQLFYKRTALDQTYFPQMELLPISEDRYINLSRQYIRYGFDYENDQAIASYSYIFNRDSSTWSRNTLEDDYILRLKN